SGQDAHGRRFAGPVRAKKPDQLAGGHLEVDVIDGQDRAVLLAQVLGPDGVVAHGLSRGYRSAGFLMVWAGEDVPSVRSGGVRVHVRRGLRTRRPDRSRVTVTTHGMRDSLQELSDRY